MRKNLVLKMKPKIDGIYAGHGEIRAPIYTGVSLPSSKYTLRPRVEGALTGRVYCNLVPVHSMYYLVPCE